MSKYVAMGAAAACLKIVKMENCEATETGVGLVKTLERQLLVGDQASFGRADQQQQQRLPLLLLLLQTRRSAWSGDSSLAGGRRQPTSSQNKIKKVSIKLREEERGGKERCPRFEAYWFVALPPAPRIVRAVRPARSQPALGQSRLVRARVCSTSVLQGSPSRFAKLTLPLLLFTKNVNVFNKKQQQLLHFSVDEYDTRPSSMPFDPNCDTWHQNLLRRR
ncbi:hypothetical protein B566_EDAN003618 [Ephemera danica]|nr:hypothetical protein B566_EDAN003618 [Ephemera danica]